jgi:hypothetical protein
MSLDILQYMMGKMTADTALTAIVDPTNMFTGPVDIVIESQPETTKPMIILSTISEKQRTIPPGARDTQIQIDLWSWNSQFEVEQIYEEIINLFSYNIADKNFTHIFWDRLEGAIDLFEDDRRVFHKACTVILWSLNDSQASISRFQ